MSITIKMANPLWSETPTCVGPYGLLYDFNKGCRVYIPAGTYDGVDRHIKIYEMDTGIKIYESKLGNEEIEIKTPKLWFMRYAIEIWEGNIIVWQHETELRNKQVLITTPHNCCIGDGIIYMSQIQRFADKHDCAITTLTTPILCDLFKGVHPNVSVATEQEWIESGEKENTYASYRLGIFIDRDGEFWTDYSPVNFKQVSLLELPARILGLHPSEVRPKVNVAQPNKRPIEEKYVC